MNTQTEGNSSRPERMFSILRRERASRRILSPLTLLREELNACTRERANAPRKTNPDRHAGGFRVLPRANVNFIYRGEHLTEVVFRSRTRSARAFFPSEMRKTDPRSTIVPRNRFTRHRRFPLRDSARSTDRRGRGVPNVAGDAF